MPDETLVIQLTAFGAEILDAEVSRQARPADQLVEEAVLHLLAESRSRRIATRVPPLQWTDTGLQAREVRLELEEASWLALSEEAGRQREPVERLIEHAVLLYLADLDAGGEAGSAPR
jgi:hypothetical protein